MYNKTSEFFSVKNSIKLFAGLHVYDKKQLYDAIYNVVYEEDDYADERKKITNKLINYTDGNSSYRILNYIGIE